MKGASRKKNGERRREKVYIFKESRINERTRQTEKAVCKNIERRE